MFLHIISNIVGEFRGNCTECLNLPLILEYISCQQNDSNPENLEKAMWLSELFGECVRSVYSDLCALPDFVRAKDMYILLHLR